VSIEVNDAWSHFVNASTTATSNAWSHAFTVTNGTNRLVVTAAHNDSGASAIVRWVVDTDSSTDLLSLQVYSESNPTGDHMSLGIFDFVNPSTGTGLIYVQSEQPSVPDFGVVGLSGVDIDAESTSQNTSDASHNVSIGDNNRYTVLFTVDQGATPAFTTDITNAWNGFTSDTSIVNYGARCGIHAANAGGTPTVSYANSQGAVIGLSYSMAVSSQGTAGTLTLTGAFTRLLKLVRTFSGTLDLVGTMQEVRKRFLAGTLALLGTMQEVRKKFLVGVLSLAGVFSSRLVRSIKTIINLVVNPIAAIRTWLTPSIDVDLD